MGSYWQGDDLFLTPETGVTSEKVQSALVLTLFPIVLEIPLYFLFIEYYANPLQQARALWIAMVMIFLAAVSLFFFVFFAQLLIAHFYRADYLVFNSKGLYYSRSEKHRRVINVSEIQEIYSQGSPPKRLKHYFKGLHFLEMIEMRLLLRDCSQETIKLYEYTNRINWAGSIIERHSGLLQSLLA
ncbi:MAG: hypothetical protein ACE5OZ_21755 [Candidatus Heimdallarchaeota archaeon]